MNAVCTIVSKNYLAQALTLGDSIINTNRDVNFHILLADEKDNLDLNSIKYPIIESKNIGLSFWEDMAFKYDVIEYNTATKPFFIEWLFNKYNYEKLLYIDPDCYVYNELNYAFNELNKNFIILTPHIIDPQMVDQAAIPETEHLFDGIYNLGFVGIANNIRGRYILNWWKSRLKTFGYADRCESLHVDQKWMDFIPSMFSDGVKIIRNYGYNVAHWNFHERLLTIKNGKYIINNKDELVIFHFSGFNPLDKETFTKPSKQNKYDYSNRKDLVDIHEEYRNFLLNNQFERYYKMKYSYSYYNNGKPISKLNRRLYRKLTTNNNISFNNPFDCNSEFYKLMEKNNLISNIDTLVDLGKVNIDSIKKKDKSLKIFLKIIKMLLGVDKYNALLKGLHIYSKYEKQDFLIKGLL